MKKKKAPTKPICDKCSATVDMTYRLLYDSTSGYDGETGKKPCYLCERCSREKIEYLRTHGYPNIKTFEETFGGA